MAILWGIAVVVAGSGCAAMAPAPAKTVGVDAVVATNADGERLLVFPAAGIMLRDGSRESVDVQVKWEAAQDPVHGRMRVLSADGARVYADVSVGQLAIQHRLPGGAGFTTVAGPPNLGELTAVDEAPSE